MNLVFFKSHCRSQRDDVTVKRLVHPQGGSQPSVAPVLGRSMPSSGFHGLHTCRQIFTHIF